MKLFARGTQSGLIQTMAVDPDSLKMRVCNTSLTFVGGGVRLSATAEVYYPGLDIVVDTAPFAATVASFDRMEEANAEIYAKMQSRFAEVKAWHQPRSALGERSVADAALILAWWSFAPLGAGLWTLSHSVSGEFAGVPLSAGGKGQPTLVGRVAAIVQRVSPPPLWAWATTLPYAGALEVKCVSVNGADHYAVYNDLGGGKFEHLGDVADATPNTIEVAAGTYNVCMAAVDSSEQVGILSKRTIVEVS